MKLSTGSEQEQRRDELLRVATALAAGMWANMNLELVVNDLAIEQAKDLIAKVDVATHCDHTNECKHHWIFINEKYKKPYWACRNPNCDAVKSDEEYP